MKKVESKIMKKFSPKACKIMMSLVHEISSAINITNWTGVNVHRLITALSLYWCLSLWDLGRTDFDWCPALWIQRESFFLNFSYLGSHLCQELVQSLLWEHGFPVDILVPQEGCEFLVVFPQKLPFSQCRVRHSGFGSMCWKQAVRGRNTPWWCEASGVSVETWVRTVIHLYSFMECLFQWGELKCQPLQKDIYA